MASIASLMGAAGAATYCASKHAVMGLIKSAALETAKNGIRINAICPAVIETATAGRLFSSPEIIKLNLALHPIGRVGKPMEVAEALV